MMGNLRIEETRTFDRDKAILTHQEVPQTSAQELWTSQIKLLQLTKLSLSYLFHAIGSCQDSVQRNRYRRPLTAFGYPGARPPLCVHVFPNFGIGGVQLRIVRILNDLGKEFRHVVITLDSTTEAAAYIGKEVDCSVVSLPIPKSKLVSSLCVCMNELRRRRPDLLVTYNWGAIEWAMANRLFTRFPHVHHEAGFGNEEATKQLSRRILFRRWALQHAKTVVPSRTLEKIALTDWCLPKASLIYVPMASICPGKFSGWMPEFINRGAVKCLKSRVEG
jgi:hypothetical protein